MSINKYRNQICVIIATVAALLLTFIIVRTQEVEAKVSKTQHALAGEVFRFHVLANSDSESDQDLKMTVKAAVIEYMKESLPQAESAAQTKEWAADHITDIEAVAAEIIADEGYDYPVTAEITNCYFPDKTYGDVTFPAGEYEALRICIGAAKGHNWWCVLYPNLCFIDAAHAVVPEEGKEELKQVLTDEEYEMVTATSDFKIKWFFFGDEEKDKP